MKKLLATLFLTISIGLFAQITDEVENSPNVEKSMSLEEARPLILINDIEINFDELNDINMDEIESVHIIKKKEDLKKYGEKGENGAIIMELKKDLNPIVFLDGKEIAFDDANEINHNTIDRIVVLKDQGAVDKYGVKGVKGVLEIYSKEEIEE